PTDQHGWYEDTPQPSIDLFNLAKLEKNASILIVGGGSSKFINHLVKENYNNLIVNDISESALEQLQEELGDSVAAMRFIEDDLCKPEELYRMPNVDFWHDRAVLHFFTERDQQKAYFELLDAKVKAGGYVMLGEFNKDGAEMCAGLSLCRYDLQMMTDRLGEDFMLIEHFDSVFINPWGEERPYIYALFKRHND
ncbi:class I SAM-dependent methyltransferase, partial [Crocinitomix catalasitica]|nr:class I SAM-dependent methyltransferase [Crocinitomix catalasitica]